MKEKLEKELKYLEKKNESIKIKLKDNVEETTQLTIEMCHNNSIQLRIRYDLLVKEFPILTEQLSKIQEDLFVIRTKLRELS